MKVIKHPATFQPIDLTCGHCGALLQADSRDDFVRHVYGDFRESWDYAVATCPCCQHGIRIESNQFPKHVYEALKRVND